MSDVSRPNPPIVVSAVILTYQRQDLLPACLHSLVQALGAVGEETEIIVVDNASPGNRATPQIAELCPSARVLTLTENRGYAGGVQAGLDAARGQWVLTIGDDATIEPDAVVAMLAAGRSSAAVGSVAAAMLFADRSDGAIVNSAGIEIDRLGIAIDRLVGAPAAAVAREMTEVFGSSGGAALYRRSMLDDIGGFDTSFGVYLEDADLAWRARIAGWRCLHEPRAVVHHHHSATTRHRSDSKYFHVGRNRVRMLAKNATRGHLLVYGPLIVAYDLAYVAYALAVDRTTAPIRGRVAGLKEWRRYRRALPTRRPVGLVAPRGLRAALARNAAVSGRRSRDGEATGATERARQHSPPPAGDPLVPQTGQRASVDAVFLTSNSRDQALQCIAHLREPEIASIVAVDNASSDGTVAVIRGACCDVTVLSLEAPTGLATALNRGADLGSAPFVLYLNDDVFAVPGSVRLLVDALQSREDAVAAAGRLVDDDLTTQNRYRPQSFPSPATIATRLLGLERLWQCTPGRRGRVQDDHTTVSVDQPAGACLLVRRSVAQQIGGWDERYWFWYEDVDFSRRLAAHGTQLYVPSAPFRHIGGSTARRLTAREGHARYFHGVLQYSDAHFSPAGRAVVACALLLVSLSRALLRLAMGDRAGSRTYLAAARGAVALARGTEIKPLHTAVGGAARD